MQYCATHWPVSFLLYSSWLVLLYYPVFWRYVTSFLVPTPLLTCIMFTKLLVGSFCLHKCCLIQFDVWCIQWIVNSQPDMSALHVSVRFILYIFWNMWWSTCIAQNFCSLVGKTTLECFANHVHGRTLFCKWLVLMWKVSTAGLLVGIELQ